MTRRELTLARLVISSSVMPSAKYSSAESPERFARGNTAMERITGAPGVECAVRESASLYVGHASSAAAAATARTVLRREVLFSPGPGMAADGGIGLTAFLCDSLAGPRAPSGEPFARTVGKELTSAINR